MKKIVFVLVLMMSGLVMANDGVPKIVINPLGHSGKIFNILFTPDGEKIISVSEDKTIRIWDSKTGEMLNKFESQIGAGPQGMFYSSAISPDGKLLAVGGYPVNNEEKNYIQIIDLEQGKQVATAIGHTNVINALDFDASGKYLASGSDDGTIHIWRVSYDEVYRVAAVIETNNRVASLSFNNKNNMLAASIDDKYVYLYDMSGLSRGMKNYSAVQLKRHKGEVKNVKFSPDGNYLASTSYTNEVMLWDGEGEFVMSFDHLDQPINAITFSHDSRVLVMMNDIDGVGHSYSIPQGSKFADFYSHDNTVFAADFSPESKNGNYVVASAGGNNNEIFIWNAINGKHIKRIKGKGATIWDMEFGKGMELYVSNKFLKSGKVGKPAFMFDFNTFTTTKDPGSVPHADLYKAGADVVQTSPFTIEVGNNEIVNDQFEDGRILDFIATPDGKVVVGSDFSLKLYSSSGALLKEFLGHTGGVRAVAVSRDGRYMASGSEDQSIRLWNLSEKGEVPSLREVFDDQVWADYFDGMDEEMNALTTENTNEAWLTVIQYLKDYKDKTYRDIEAVHQNLGEVIRPFVNLFVSDDLEWVCWTPTGYFHSSSQGGQYFGWHINRGIKHLADYYSAEQYFEILYRPEELLKSIQQAKRVKEILIEEGERIFDLAKLSRPSAGFFDNSDLTYGANKVLTYKDGKYTTKEKALTLQVDVYDGGGGIKELNLYQNGKLIYIDDEIKSISEDNKIRRTYKVDLLNGQNDFKVVVLNYQKVESKPDYIKILYSGDMLATANLYILSVGVNKYKNPKYNLNYAQPDAKSFIDKVIERGSKMFKSVKKIEIYDSEATKANINAAFETVVKAAKPEDVFVFYYAGHGSLDDQDDNRYYLVPTDVTQLYGDTEQLKEKAISADELKANLALIKPQKQLILLDACHSGGAMKAFKTRAAASEEKALVQLARASGVVLIAASQSQQFATEFDELGHGVFTYSLLEAMDGKADNGDGKVTVKEIARYMEDRVPEISEKYNGEAQFPTGFSHGQDFPISLLANATDTSLDIEEEGEEEEETEQDN